MRKILILSALAAMLAGCASEPKVIYRSVEVQIPVSVPCKAPEVERPRFALDGATVSQGLYTKGAAALAEIEQRRAYEKRLEAAVAACR